MSSNIEWTDVTWNPVVGCTPVSPGCLNCYAATMARRLEGMGRPEYQPRVCVTCGGTGAVEKDGVDRGCHLCRQSRSIRIAEVKNGRAVFTGDVRTVPDRLTDPLHWRKPRRVFVNSMSDLFHEAVPFEFVDRVFAVMALCPRHTFQVLTKRPERMAEYLRQGPGHSAQHRVGGDDQVRRHPKFDTPLLDWPLPNVWLGTSIESDDQHARAWALLKCPAAVRFLSLEPLIGPVDLDRWELLCKAWSEKRPTMGLYIDWVIVGGESGTHARPCDVAWIRSIVRQCRDAGVPCFVKQLGAAPMLGDVSEPHGWPTESGPVDWETGRIRLANRKGADPAEWPEDLRVRQWPVQRGPAGAASPRHSERSRA